MVVMRDIERQNEEGGREEGGRREAKRAKGHLHDASWSGSVVLGMEAEAISEGLEIGP